MATDVKRSAFNPFRTPTVTPNPTGAGPSVESNARSPDPQRSHDARSPTPTPANSSQSHNAGTQVPERSSVSGLAAELEATTLEESGPAEPPPAYTPAADMYTGEATVEYGPRRPFQPAPPPPPLPQYMSPHLTGMSQGSYFVGPQMTGPQMPQMPMGPGFGPMTSTPTGGWSQYPGQGRRDAVPGRPSNLGPPPRHPSMRGREQSATPRVTSAPVGSPPRPLSDFARDFYNAAPGEASARRAPSISRSDGSSEPEVTEPEPAERVRPSARTASSSFAPPQGPPAPSPGDASSSAYAPPAGPPPPTPYAPPNGRPPPPHDSRGASSSEDDGKPTTSPTPGRPLLNKGRVLIYPTGYECRKCLNTGYKKFDPSHPCRKCWERHSKPYNGAILYAPRSPGFQRPLPTFRPPHLLRHRHTQSQPSLAPLSPAGLSRTNSQLRPCSTPGPAPSPGMPGMYPGSPGGFVQPPPPMPRPQLNFSRGPPPPGATIVGPGDPRIGGRICWRCGGDGTVSFMIFDVEQCPMCNGLGRVFS